MGEELLARKGTCKFPDVFDALVAVLLAQTRTNAAFTLIARQDAFKIERAIDLVRQAQADSIFTDMWFSDLSKVSDRLIDAVCHESGVEPDIVQRLFSIEDATQSVESIVIYQRLIRLIEAVARMQAAFTEKAVELADVVRASRRHMHEAAPDTWGRVFGAQAVAFDLEVARLESLLESFTVCTLGSDISGAAYACEGEYQQRLMQELQRETGVPLCRPRSQAEPVEGSALRLAVTGEMRLMHLGSELHALAMIYAKIAHGFFIYGSGPKAGLAEITVPAIAPGSTIMPGKINPSMPMLMIQIAEYVLASDQMSVYATNEMDFDTAWQTGGAMMTALEAIEILTRGSDLFLDKCIRGFGVNAQTSRSHAHKSAASLRLVQQILGEELANQVQKRFDAPSADFSAMSAEVADAVEQLLDVDRLAREGLDLNTLKRCFAIRDNHQTMGATGL